MAFKEIKFGGETLNWKKGDVAQGKLEEVRENVGKNESTIYTIAGKQYWGTGVLDQLMDRITVGQMVRVTCTDDQFKFPNGRVGRNFKVEVDQ